MSTYKVHGVELSLEEHSSTKLTGIVTVQAELRSLAKWSVANHAIAFESDRR